MNRRIDRMKIKRKLLHDQYGLIWFGGIMTFMHRALVVGAPAGENSVQWDPETYYIPGNDDVLDKVFAGLLQFSADHLRPQTGCCLGDIHK